MIEKMVNKEELIESISAAFPKSILSKSKNVLYLNLGDPKYKLNDLDELDKDYEYIQFFLHMNTIDINNNRLSILKLKGYNFLEKIVATNNMISKVELNLPKLKKLDIGSNMIDKIPDLANLPNLEELRLYKNSITKISFEDFKFVKATLNTIDLSFNKIVFPKSKDFFDFVEIFGKNMRKLRAININKNPFSMSKIYAKEYSGVFTYYCASLNAIDGKTLEDSEKDQSKQINSLKNKILENEREYGGKYDEVTLKKKQGDKEEITLEYIKRGMERYQTVSRMGQSSFKDLKDVIEEYFFNIRFNAEQQRGEDDDDEEIEEFEKIIEYCNVIIENSSAMEKPLFDIIANFAIIKNGKFSDHSLTFFKHHLSSSGEKANDILEVIDRTIIDFINKQPTEEIPASIISGLQSFATEPKFKKMILDLVKKLRGIIEAFKELRVIGSKTGASEENKKRNILNAAVNFLSMMSNDEEIINSMIESENFLDSLSNHLKNLMTTGDEIILSDERALDININILNIIRSIAVYEPNNLSSEEKQRFENNYKMVKLSFVAGLKDKIEQVLLKKLDLYIKALSENTEGKKLDSKGKEQKLKSRYLLSNYIKCYGSLMMRTDDKSKLNFSKTSVTMILLNILPLPNFNDPVIVASICQFVLYLLYNPNIINNIDELFNTIVFRLYSLKYVLVFLTKGPKFNQACVVAESMGQNTLTTHGAVDFENLTSDVMHEMFINIINLIKFFGKNAAKGNLNIQQTCINICSDLNDMERDNALTGCLTIPSDDVKKAVVECLFYVDCNEFDKDEIKAIYIQMANINLAAGNIEEVISIIFIILTKAFRLFMLDTGASKEKVEANKEAFILAYEFILKNSERYTSDIGESEQKLTLSLALNTFLVNMSCFDGLKKFFLERKNSNKISKILYLEESKFNELAYLPIEIEKTMAGWSMINLHECFKNDHPLYPYSFVYLRIIIHIADLMMNTPYKIYDIPDDLEFAALVEHLKKQVYDREYNRIQREMRSFKDFSNEAKKNKKLFSNSSEYVFLNSNDYKEEQYKFINLLPTILHFLLGKTSQSKIAEFEKVWDDKFDPTFSRLSYSLNETKLKREKDDKIKIDEAYYKSENIYTRTQRIMREEPKNSAALLDEVISEYDHIHNDLNNIYRYGSEYDKMIRIQSQETANNPYLRGLVISAFLRAIWGLLEFPQEKAIKDHVIEILKKGNNIKDISLLVDSTKLVEFNIASKYLVIMRYVLFHKTTKSTKVNLIEETEYLNQIGVISFMIKKMINVNRYNLRMDSEESKIFLSDMSKCCAVICSEVFNLHYSNEIVRAKTLGNIISYDVIKVFIKTVKECMNLEVSMIKKEQSLMRLELNKSVGSDSDEQVKKKELNPVKVQATLTKLLKQSEALNDMNFTIATIIGDYISKCKQYSYNILESFTRSYIFERVKLRKTYLREIIEISKMSDLKVKIEVKCPNAGRISFLGRCFVNDYYNKLATTAYFVISENAIEFIKCETGFTNKEWELEEYIWNERMRIKFEEITDIIELEVTNRMFIRTKKAIYGFYFLKSNVVGNIIELLQIINSSINILRGVRIFKRENNDEDEYKEEDKLDNVSSAFMCVALKIGGMLNLFGGFFKEKVLIPNSKILFIQNKKITIFSENMERWNSINIDDYIRTENGIVKVANFQNLYSFVYDYEMNNLTGATFEQTENINLNFDGTILKLKLLDDTSYFNLKKMISLKAVEKMFDLDSEDVYENIK